MSVEEKKWYNITNPIVRLLSNVSQGDMEVIILLNKIQKKHDAEKLIKGLKDVINLCNAMIKDLDEFRKFN